jgi:hypothetical protein
MQVRAERTGWRDEALSGRHRRWGWDCPAVDLDFLFLEYDHGKASAIVEYKNEHAAPQYASHPTYRAMIDLGDRAGVPVIACRYSDDFSEWNAVPLNDEAKKYLSNRMTLSEREWVRLLYRIRGYECPESILNGIYTEI